MVLSLLTSLYPLSPPVPSRLVRPAIIFAFHHSMQIVVEELEQVRLEREIGRKEKERGRGEREGKREREGGRGRKEGSKREGVIKESVSASPHGTARECRPSPGQLPVRGKVPAGKPETHQLAESGRKVEREREQRERESREREEERERERARREREPDSSCQVMASEVVELSNFGLLSEETRDLIIDRVCSGWGLHNCMLVKK